MLTAEHLEDRITQNSLNLVNVATTGLEQAMDKIAVFEAGKVKAAQMASGILKLMLDTGLISGTDKQAAEIMLGSHAETMMLLKNACDELVELRAIVKKANLDPIPEPKKEKKGASELGNPEPDIGSSKEKSSSKLPHLIGSRSDGNRESDIPLLNLAGIPH